MVKNDPEVEAMQAVVAALEDLQEDQRARVLDWSAKRYGVSLAGAGRRASARGAAQTGNGDPGNDDEDAEFEDFSDLLTAAQNPADEADRALVGGYWHQVVRNGQSFTSQQVNTVLKDAGYGIGNITRAIDALKARRPQEVRQLAKKGTSRQARKTYKLTGEGIASVRRMIDGEDAGA